MKKIVAAVATLLMFFWGLVPAVSAEQSHFEFDAMGSVDVIETQDERSADVAHECVSEEAITLEELQEGLNLLDCGEVEFLDVNGESYWIPDVGTGYAAIAIGTESVEESLALETSLTGELSVSIETEGDAEFEAYLERIGWENDDLQGYSTQDESASVVRKTTSKRVTTASCTESHRNTVTGMWGKTFNWYVNDKRSLPTKGITASSLVSDSKAAASVWQNGTTLCSGYKGKPRDLKMQYKGITTKQSNINGAEAKCAAKADGISVVDVAVLRDNTLGLACNRWTLHVVLPPQLTEVDIRLTNKVSWHSGASTSCTGSKFDVRTILIHEFGHAIGLGHTPNGTTQVMRPGNGACDTMGTLGQGDKLSLFGKYGHTR